MGGKPIKTDPSFPDRLQRIMREIGWSKSDLARGLWGTVLENRSDGTAYEVPKNRQAVSRYLNGKVYPNDDTRQRLADVLGVNYAELFPNEDPTNRPGSGITLSQVNKRDCVLDIHITIPTERALEVIKMVKEYSR